MIELLVILFAGVLVFSFGFVLLFGAPYLPTLRPQIDTALDMLKLEPGQIMLEIGSGDGRVLAAAAERGIHAVGYELNPIMYLVSLWTTRKVRPRVRVIWGNAWKKEWPKADAIYIFGLDKLMPKLHKKIMQDEIKDLKVVSFTFQIPRKKHAEYREGIYLYQY